MLSCILTPTRLSLVVRLLPSNATDEIEGDIPSSDCQFEMDSLESGVFTNFFVWSVITVTSDLSAFRLLLRISGGMTFRPVLRPSFQSILNSSPNGFFLWFRQLSNFAV